MFITAEVVCDGAAPRPFQFSDSSLTLRMLHSVISMALRRAGGLGPCKLEYCDDDGDWVCVAHDRDVSEMFAVALAMKPKSLQVILLCL